MIHVELLNIGCIGHHATTLLSVHVTIASRGACWLSGSVVGLWSERLGVRNLPLPCCVHEEDTLFPESTGKVVIPRKQWLRPEMTEKLLTGSLIQSMRWHPSVCKKKNLS